MKGLKDTLANLAELRSRFERRVAAAAKRGGGETPVAAAGLREVAGFGSNPGRLRMLTHVPRGLAKSSPLVVALHGCTQTAAGYDRGSGWSALADAYGFAVLFPEQQRPNNPNTCFNWFLPAHTARDKGEALSIRQMVERMLTDHGLDRRRVFVAGLSAGGAMTSTMLATYPELFAGGAIVAGLPFGAASNVQQAFEAMARGREHSAQQWGDMVRSASAHRGRWPKLSVWHGTSDTIVNAANMDAVLEQWINVHAITTAPRLDQVEGHARRVWRSPAGEDVIEAIAIGGMGHGVPVATGGSDGWGHPGPFHLDVGISSSHHIVQFWNLAGKRRGVAPAPETAAARESVPAPAAEASLLAAREAASAGAFFADPQAVIAAALQSAGVLDREPSGQPRKGNPLDPRGIVASTLRSVGLLKD